jgi:hypothetical protein
VKKIIYGFYRKQLRFLRRNYYFISVLSKSWFNASHDKRVYLDISEIQLNRYLANLVIYFHSANYTIYLPRNKKIIEQLSAKNGEWRYLNLILICRIKFVKKRKTNHSNIRKIKLSNDYYRIDNGTNYRVPIGQYPYLYTHYNFPKILPSEHRINSLFMSGNIDSRYYSKLDSNPHFEMPSRLKIFNYLRSQSSYHTLNSMVDWQYFMRNPINKVVIIIDKSTQFSLPFKEHKIGLCNFQFYLAMPGIEVPESHNLIEAIKNGCIPIIHEEYAKLMNPPLIDGQNAIIYRELCQLNNTIQNAFKISKEEINLIRKNVIAYYENYLNPKVIVNRIISGEFKMILVQGEVYSLR